MELGDLKDYFEKKSKCVKKLDERKLEKDCLAERKNWFVEKQVLESKANETLQLELARVNEQYQRDIKLSEINSV